MKKLISLFMAARLYILLAPVSAYFAGNVMNQAVLAANEGKFPVLVSDRSNREIFKTDKDGMMDEVHCRMTNKTRLNWLADFYNLHTIILSPGDLLLWLGTLTGPYAVCVWGTFLVADITNRRKATEKCAYCD